MRKQAEQIDIMEKKLLPLLEALDANKNTRYADLQYTIKDNKRNIAYYEKSIEDYRKRLAEAEGAIKKLKFKKTEPEDLISSLEQIKKHKKIDWAFLTEDLNLIVQTKPLTQFDPYLEKDTKAPVGRYAFKIGLSQYERSLSIAALDFVSQRHRHPNMMSHPGGACWGGYDSTIRKMFDAGNFFGGIDAMMLFFSTFPQQGGHKPLYWHVWLAHREVSFLQNPWYDQIHKSIYTVGKPMPAKEKKYRFKREKIAIDRGTEYVLAELNFRNY